MVSQNVALDYLEQPVTTMNEMHELKQVLAERGLKVKIAADELVRKANDPLNVARAGAADVLVLKAQPLGGVAKSLEIADQSQLPVVISSALESSVGLSMGVYLAAALPNAAFENGLGTAALLAGDVTREPLLPVDGWLEVRRPVVASSQVDIFRAEDHRTDWWIERLERCLNLIEG
jgi:O-succinylbenzoate synthase